MRILLFGKNGQLGWELHRTLTPLGEIIALDRKQADFAYPNDLRQIVRMQKPEVIVNAVAYTDVDGAESNRELAMRINAEAPGVLANEAKRLGAFMVHYSTDYVYDGKKGKPYVEIDKPNPINTYGATKLEGERAVEQAYGDFLLLRVAWVYSLRRNSFVTKVLKWAHHQDIIRVVDDQISNPSWARMLAQATSAILARGIDYLVEHKGLYNLAASGFASRFELAREILNHGHFGSELPYKELQPAKTLDFPAPAKRPAMSALDCQKAKEVFELNLPRWEEALYSALDPSQKN